MTVAKQTPAAKKAEDAKKDDGNPSKWVDGVLVVVATGFVLLLLYALWKFWPTAATLKTGDMSPVNFLGIHRLVSPDVRMFIVVAIAGALGGLMHSTRSFAWYVGYRKLRWRWFPYYILTPVIGAGLATIVYAVTRGGLFSSSATTDVNPYGFVAIGAIVGLFTEQALEMLHNVASNFFAEAPQGADNVTDQDKRAEAAGGAAAGGGAGQGDDGPNVEDHTGETGEGPDAAGDAGAGAAAGTGDGPDVEDDAAGAGVA